MAGNLSLSNPYVSAALAASAAYAYFAYTKKTSPSTPPVEAGVDRDNMQFIIPAAVGVATWFVVCMINDSNGNASPFTPRDRGNGPSSYDGPIYRLSAGTELGGDQLYRSRMLDLTGL